MLIKKASEMNLSHGIKAVIYSGSGTGKTSQIKELVKHGFKPLVLSAEGGLLSLGDSQVDVIDLNVDDKGNALAPELRFEQLIKAYNFLSKSKDYDTVVLDSLTEINQIVMSYLRSQDKYKDPKNTLQMFGENLNIMNNIVKKFRDLPINVILIALESVEKDEVGRRFTTMDLVGKASSNVPPLFDEILYMFIEEDGTRKFLTNKTDKIVAKDRSGKLAMVEQADIGYIFKKIKQTNKKGE